MKKEWCNKKETHLTDLSCHGLFRVNMPKPRRYRCPDCKKRFMTVIRSCGDSCHTDEGPACCWHEFLPSHKKRKKKNE
jgi:hypothetical protein